MGAAIADKFERRWQATDDMPLMPVPARDPLAGLIGGTQIGPHDFAAVYCILPPRPVHGQWLNQAARC